MLLEWYSNHAHAIPKAFFYTLCIFLFRFFYNRSNRSFDLELFAMRLPKGSGCMFPKGLEGHLPIETPKGFLFTPYGVYCFYYPRFSDKAVIVHHYTQGSAGFKTEKPFIYKGTMNKVLKEIQVGQLMAFELRGWREDYYNFRVFVNTR